MLETLDFALIAGFLPFWPTVVEHLREFIKSQTIRLRNTGIRDIIALGDFNSESFSLGGDYREICHSELCHKHSPTAKATRIDKAAEMRSEPRSAELAAGA